MADLIVGIKNIVFNSDQQIPDPSAEIDPMDVFALIFVGFVPLIYLGIWFLLIYLSYKFVTGLIWPIFYGSKRDISSARARTTFFSQDAPSLTMDVGGIAGMSENAATELTAKVTRALMGGA